MTEYIFMFSICAFFFFSSPFPHHRHHPLWGRSVIFFFLFNSFLNRCVRTLNFRWLFCFCYVHTFDFIFIYVDDCRWIFHFGNGRPFFHFAKHLLLVLMWCYEKFLLTDERKGGRLEMLTQIYVLIYCVIIFPQISCNIIGYFTECCRCHSFLF